MVDHGRSLSKQTGKQGVESDRESRTNWSRCSEQLEATWRVFHCVRMPASCATRRGGSKGMPYNTTICGVSFVGPILIVGTAGEDFSDLTEQQEHALRAMGAIL